MRSNIEEKNLHLLCPKGPEAYGSKTNLQKKRPRKKVETLLGSKKAHTKYRQFRRKFPRLEIISCGIDEIWSIDVAYVDKLAKYNHGVKFWLVAIVILSRNLGVETMHSKSAEETAKAFARIIKKMKQQKGCSNKGTEFKSAFESFCQSNNLATFSIHSEAKSDVAERYIRSLKSKIHSH